MSAIVSLPVAQMEEVKRLKARVRELELEVARLRQELAEEGDEEHSRWTEATQWKLIAEEMRKAGNRMVAMIEVAPNAPISEWPTDDEMDAVVANWKKIWLQMVNSIDNDETPPTLPAA